MGDAFVDTVRVARDFGTVSEILPDGFDDVRDCPHVFFDAIRSALVILSFDELPKDERPPKRYWLNGDKLNAWFRGVEAKRDEKYGSKTIDDPVSNDAAGSLIAG